MRTRNAWWTMALAGALATPLAAQVGPGPGGQGQGLALEPRGGLAEMLETALERQDALELTDDQVTTLEELQTAVVAAQEAARTDMQNLRDRLQDEGADRVRIREEMMDLRERLRASHAPFRSQLGETLTLEQGWILMDAMRENRQAVRGGRAGPCAHGRTGPARGRGGVGGVPARGSRGGGPGGA